MVEKPSEIEREIRDSRQELGRNLHELEGKMKDASDWKVHFRKHPTGLMGLAFGGGILLAAILGPGKRSPSVRAENYPPPASYPKPKSLAPLFQDKRITETWDVLKGAMIGLAATKAKEMLDQMLPGFGEHYDKASRADRPLTNRVM